MSNKLSGVSRWVPHLVWLLVAVMALAAGFRAGQSGRPDGDAVAASALQTRLDVMSAQYRHELSGLASARDALQSQLLIEQTTRTTLEASLQKAQTELATTRERLAFYEQLLPPGPAGAVTIRAFDLEPRAGLLAYRVLLMRDGAQGTAFNGLMEFVANGVQNGKNVKMTLSAAAAADPQSEASGGSGKNPLQLSFDQFQRAEGLLGVPPGFVVKSVTLNIMEGANVRATRSASVATSEPVGSTY